MASTVYYIASTLSPAHETYLDKAILPDDADLDAAYDAKSDDLEQSSVAEKASVRAEVKSARSL